MKRAASFASSSWPLYGSLLETVGESRGIGAGYTGQWGSMWTGELSREDAKPMIRIGTDLK